MKKHTLFLFLVVCSGLIYGQPKFHSVPNVYMQAINNNTTATVQILPWHVHSSLNPNEYNPTSQSFFGEAVTDDEPLKAKYLGQKPLFAHQVVNDKSGNLLFFIVDNYIYNKDGFGVEREPSSLDYYVLHDNFNPYDDDNCDDYFYHNIIVVPVPNSCNEFFIFYVLHFRDDYGTDDEPTPDLYYRKLTMNSDTDFDLTNEVKLSTNFDGACNDCNNLALNITEYDDDFENYILAIHWNTQIALFEIGQTINTIYNEQYIGYLSSNEGDENVSPETLGCVISKRPDVVMFTENSSVYYIFNCQGADNPNLLYNKICYAVFPRNFNQISSNSFHFNWTNYDTDYIIRGMECSPDRNYLYFTFYDAPGIHYFNISDLTNNSGAIPSSYSTISGTTSENFSNSDIELFRDGKLYWFYHEFNGKC